MSTSADPASNGGPRKLAWRGNVSVTGSHYWYRKRHEVERLLKRHVSLGADAQIVDFGAGAGADVLLLASIYPQSRILALDLRPEAVQRLRERFSDVPTVSVDTADLRDRLPLEDESVDLGHCSEVLEHIPDPQSLLAEFHRVIRPGGHFVITTPNQPNVFQGAFWKRRRGSGERVSSATAQREDVEVFGHISLRTVKQWDEAMAQAGFELVDFGRGAIHYGGRRGFDREGARAAFFTAEALIDLVPRSLSRPLSDQHIGLYRRAPR